LHDNITGIRAINGSGHIVEYTGAQCGCLINSWGTLGIISNVKIKSIPVAKACKTMFLTGLNDAVGTNFLAEAASASSLVSGAAHLQKAFAARLASGQLANAGGSITAIRIEGELTAIRNCTAKINQVFAYFGEMHDMDENVASQFWKEMQRLGFLTNAKGAIWKLDIMPSRSAKCVSDLSNILPLHAGYDRSGMVVWLEVPGTADANAADIRRTVARYGGSAMLVYANGKTMDEVEPFQPMTELQMAITRKIKQHFDPAGILNPGRMYDGV
jgi:glycolate oxidase FAD binding subunit